MKACRLCLITKPFTRFSKRPGSADGYRTECKDCLNASRKLQPRYGQWHKEHKEELTAYNLEYSLERQYGISLSEYRSILDFQNGGCAICGTTQFMGVGKRAHVDHCHATGKVRALLCNLCNVGIGALKEDVRIMSNAVEYVIKWQDELRKNPIEDKPYGEIK